MALLHGRLISTLNLAAFALGMAATNIIVALAWFGVNLLNVGLHSYGFTDNIATNLALFVGGEFTFILICATLLQRQENRKAGKY